MSQAKTIDACEPAFDLDEVRAAFPILHQEVNGYPLVYLDNAATSQKPEMVIDAITHYYRYDNANVHRGAHALADRATRGLEDARRKLAEFINSPTPEQIIWTRGTTEAINLVANSWGRRNLRRGDRILIPTFEHHSNIVPWQLVALDTGAEIVNVPVTAEGEIDLDVLGAMLEGPRVKLMVMSHVSNALGTVNPVAEIAAMVKRSGVKLLVDGAQAIAHAPVDVQALGCDFYAFSGHKMFGPTGIGVLWGKKDILDEMPPWQGGGEMIESVSFAAGTTFEKIPYKFEAGTPNIAGAIGLGAAVDYLASIDRVAAERHEHGLLQYALERGEAFDCLRRIGQAHVVAGVFSFVLEGIHASDVGMLLDQQGVAVRTGHHCAQPIMDQYNIQGTVRASFALYNTMQEVDRLFEALQKVKSILI